MALSPDLVAHFQAIGAVGVKREMAEGKRGQPPDSKNWLEAQAWVDAETFRLAQEAEARRDAREERTLAVTEDALAIAKESTAAALRAASAAELQAIAAQRQARWAVWSAVIAVVAAIAAASDLVNALVAWLR